MCKRFLINPCSDIYLTVDYIMVDAHLDTWKTDLRFTGDSFAFPADLFVELMENQFGSLGEHTFLVKVSLQHICDPLDDGCGTTGNPAVIWKKRTVFLGTKYGLAYI